tara:strand:- start:1917 stop:2093 length:177 start_codon:yes stop_codon:yes gene_type:complete
LARSSSRYVNYDNNELKEIVRLSQPYLYTSTLEDFVSDNFSFIEGSIIGGTSEHDLPF